MNYKYLIKQIFIISMIIIISFISLKLVFFYMPFLIAYIISLIIEPLIRKLNSKSGLTRKTSSIIVLILTFSIVIGIIVWIAFNIVSEANNLLLGLNQIVEFITGIFKNINFNKFQISKDVQELIENSSIDLINKGVSILRNFLDKTITVITHIPTMIIYLIITILATYFITSDKFYILDRMEHHMPHKWMKKIVKHSKEITSTLGNYLKAEIILILISFIIVLIGLYIFYFMGMKIKYPILMAFLIMFVDALPILGSGTIMIPWAIIEIINNNNSLGFSIIGLYVITLLARQFLEPKIVSNKIGVHPIFTLISMYTGFKIIGIVGMLIGPIILIILKNILSPFIEEGLIKSIFKID